MIGYALYHDAPPMAAGSVAGTRVALRRGNRFVRVPFLGVVCALITRFGFQVFRK